MAKEGNRVSICSFCSRMKRGVLYATARREGYNVLAMAQHLDDLAESFLMSALHNGALRSMKAHYLIDAQDIRVIRPLVYVREVEAESFAETSLLPIISETCPACFEAPKERYRTKCLLATQEALFPNLFQSLLKTLLPLTEPQVEDMLRLRREAYGRIQGPPHVPPPIAPPTYADEEAARLAQATHGQYDARRVWSAALALSRQRMPGGAGGGGRGCSGRADNASASAAAEEEELSASWFGGRLGADGEFVPAGNGHAHAHHMPKKHAHQTNGTRKPRSAQVAATATAPPGEEDEPDWLVEAQSAAESQLAFYSDAWSRWSFAVALGVSALSIVVASVKHAART